MKPFKRGFTLIELLFVLAILAVLASIILMSIRKSAQTHRINKAAYEMQEVLQAAMAYRVDQREWPAKLDCNAATISGENKKFIENYLPNENIKSLFGTQYCWGAIATNNNSGTVNPNDSQIHKPRFWAAISIPTTGNNFAHVENLAKRLSARLPNAILTSDPKGTTILTNPAQSANCTAGAPCYVKSEIVQPGAASGASTAGAGAIVGAGNCVPGSTRSNGLSSCKDVSSNGQTQYEIEFNRCGEKQKPIVTSAIDFLTMPGDSSRGWPISKYSTEASNCMQEPNTQKSKCLLTVNYYLCTNKGCDPSPIRATGDNHGKVGASYNVTCAPKSTQLKSKWL